MYVEEQQRKNFIGDSGLVSKKGITEAEKAAKTKKTGLGENRVNKGSLSEDDPPDRIGRYHLQRKLGEGGFGVV